jgi:ectoine hydroxylase-related dioxygenase (phytanoyl-CoA dioxygenase family)
MLDQQIGSYGVLDTQEASDEVDLRVEELTRVGFTVLESGVDAAELERLRARLSDVYARQAADLEAASLDASDDADVARCLLAYDGCFLELATNPALLAFCERLFGESFMLLQQNGVINRPSRPHYQLKWHRDLPFQHWVASKPIAIAALFCLDEFNAETGGTYGLPGSQAQEAFPSDAFVRGHQRVITARAGSFIVMDAMAFHRAGKNSSSEPRRGVNHLIGLPFLAQQIDIPRMLGGEHADDPFLARYLGYRWGPAASVESWRRSRFERS